MVYVEVVILVFVDIDLQMRGLVLYATSQNQVVGCQDLELFPFLVVFLFVALHGDVWVVFVVLVKYEVVRVAEHGHGVASSFVDLVVVVLEVVLFEVVVVVAGVVSAMLW